LSKFAVETINVTKQFADFVAVREANLKIAEGEFFSLLGPSGSGKTTLLRIIAGFEMPTSGAVFIGGEDVTKLPPHKRPVNMVFQNYALFPHLNVFDNVAFGLRMKKSASPADLPVRVAKAIALVRLEGFADRYPSQLSGGQQQRVALARAIVNEPQVLLLDEPLSALDPQIREEMQEELRRLQERVGICFVMVTHDQSEALTLSSRIAVCSAGAIEQVGSPTEVYESPATAFVAQFIGNSNLVPAVVKARGQTHVTFLIEGASEAQTLRFSGPKNAGDTITICVKPHAIKIVPANEVTNLPQPSSAEILLKAKVLSRTFKGASLEYVLLTSSGLKLRAASSLSTNCEIGDTILAIIQAVDLSIVPDREPLKDEIEDSAPELDQVAGDPFGPVEQAKQA
jgi:spermidine/putrescine transport system ATP-binding protein